MFWGLAKWAENGGVVGLSICAVGILSGLRKSTDHPSRNIGLNCECRNLDSEASSFIWALNKYPIALGIQNLGSQIMIRLLHYGALGGMAPLDHEASCTGGGGPWLAVSGSLGLENGLHFGVQWPVVLGNLAFQVPTVRLQAATYHAFRLFQKSDAKWRRSKGVSKP